jgi:hypothetical protein
MLVFDLLFQVGNNRRLPPQLHLSSRDYAHFNRQLEQIDSKCSLSMILARVRSRRLQRCKCSRLLLPLLLLSLLHWPSRHRRHQYEQACLLHHHLLPFSSFSSSPFPIALSAVTSTTIRSRCRRYQHALLYCSSHHCEQLGEEEEEEEEVEEKEGLLIRTLFERAQSTQTHSHVLCRPLQVKSAKAQRRMVRVGSA